MTVNRRPANNLERWRSPFGVAGERPCADTCPKEFFVSCSDIKVVVVRREDERPTKAG
jgi:hypothetical protein